MKIKDIFQELNRLAPLGLAEKWDNCGIQVAGTVQGTRKVAVALDPLPSMVLLALKWGAGLIVTHHPLYLKPVAPSREGDYLTVLRMVMGAGAWMYAAHTCLDAKKDGPADWLAEELGLSGVEVLEAAPGPAVVSAEFRPAFPVARERAEKWADAPGVHSISQDSAGRVRLVCDHLDWPEIRAMVEAEDAGMSVYAHSLDEPGPGDGIGRVGDLPEPLEWAEFERRLSGLISRRVFARMGPEGGTVSRVAYCPGSGASLMGAAFGRGADVYVTGDVKYHEALAAPGPVLDVGHFCLEEEMSRRFAGLIDESLEGVEVKFFPGEDPYRFDG